MIRVTVSGVRIEAESVAELRAAVETLSQRLSNKEAASALGVSERTVRTLKADSGIDGHITRADLPGLASGKNRQK